jgi:signal transduction histidine kinase/CheY-like chemotaxis protein
MKILGVRLRVLFAAVLPVTLVAALLSVIVVSTRIGEMEADHRERGLATVRQVAATAEFGLFAGNDVALQTLANAVARQADVTSVMLLRRDGALAARAGSPAAAPPRLPERSLEAREELLGDVRRMTQAVAATDVPLEDWMAGNPAAPRMEEAVLGYAVVELSLASIKAAERRLWLAGLLVTAVGLLLGGALALRIERAQKRLEGRIADATAELRSKKEEAELATLAKSRFLAAASHDLRQPMHALGLFVARLEQLPHGEETRQLIGNLEASVRAMQDLLDGLLDISRLDAGVEKARSGPVQVAALFEQVEREFASLAEQKGILLRVRPSPLWVASDSRLLYRILLNLVSNALRYTARGGVLVACRQRGGSARIEVYDTGAGIPADMQTEVFEEFVQLDNPERDRAKGLGLGLTIVKRTAALLGHALTLQSEPGRGSRFCVEAPITAAPAAGAAREAPPLQLDLSGLSVLVVDDDTLARAAVVELLRSWGCRVFPAAGASEARSVAAAIGRPDLIACDYRLPGGESALALVEQLRAAFGAPVPAFLISGDTDPEVLRAAEASGLTLLHKPVRPARLRALVSRLAKAPPSG